MKTALISRFVLQSSLLDEIEFTTVATLVAMATSALASAQRRIHDLQALEVANEHTRRTDAEALALDEQARRKEAELSSRAKTDFLSILGHELRQPLGVILTAAELLEKAPDIRTRERAKRTIDRQARLMARLVEDLLDLSRIQRGVLDLRKDTVNGALLLDEIAQAVRPTKSQHDQRFTVSIAPVPMFVRVDAARLRQIASHGYRARGGQGADGSARRDGRSNQPRERPWSGVHRDVARGGSREGEMFQRSVCWWSGIEGGHRAEGIRASQRAGF